MQAPQPYQGGAPVLPPTNDTVVGGNMSFNPYNVKGFGNTTTNSAPLVNDNNDTKMSNNEAFLAFL
jgi:hypothetical protein